MTYREARDFGTGKGAVGFILAQELATLTLELNTLQSTIHLGPCLLFSSHINQPSAADHHDQ